MGSVPLRSAVEYRARRLFAHRRPVGVLPVLARARRAYRWGEDGLAGISDDGQHLCLSLALWNGKDPILKERLFGLQNEEGNHGEDVKELYYHLDATPTHSYLKLLYKYPQRMFPYQQIRDESKRRSRYDPEFELLDTNLFEDNRYFDVFVEYAKAGPRRIFSCGSPRTIAAQKPLNCTFCRNSGSAIRGAGNRTSRARRSCTVARRAEVVPSRVGTPTGSGPPEQLTSASPSTPAFRR